MKKIITFSAACLLSVSGLAQISTYQISEYLYPDVERKTLRLSPDVDFSSYNSPSTDYSDLNVYVNLSGTDFINSRKRQLRLNYVLNTGYLYLSENHPSQRNQSDLYGGLYMNLVNRFFFKPKRFFEVETNGSFDYDTDRGGVGSGGSNNRNEIYLTVAANPKIGFGRLELVSDAWHAVTILEELQKAGSLQKDLTHDEITALANEISQLKNYRSVDFRLEQIYEFEKLATYLVENGYTEASDYKSFAILKDAYDFEDFIVRENGQQFKVGLDLSYYYFNDDFTADRTQTSSYYGLAVEYDRNKVLSTDWQLDQTYSFRAGQRHLSPLTTEIVSKTDYLALEINHKLGYFLSRRTSFRLGLRAIYRANNNQADWVSVALRPEYLYYISPQLRFNCGGNLSYYKNDNDFSTDFHSTQSNFSAGIDYFFY